jgi:hypothetical protein
LTSFCHGKFNQTTQNGFGRKTDLGNLGPTAQATLVHMKNSNCIKCETDQKVINHILKKDSEKFPDFDIMFQ